MSNYSSLLGINHKGQYISGIFAGEGHGSSQMTYTLGKMINSAISTQIRMVNQVINATIEAQMQALIIQLISQLLVSVSQPPQDNGNTESNQETDNTQELPLVDGHSLPH